MLICVRTALLVTGFATLTGSAVAQPRDGELVLSVLHSRTWAQGLVVHFDPANPKLATLSANVVPNAFSDYIRMGSNNDDVVVSEIESTFARGGWMTRIDPRGRGTTLAYLSQAPEGFELDGDDTWVVAGAPFQAQGNILYGVNDHSGAVNTFFSFTPTGTFFQDVAVVREDYPYAVAAFTFTSIPSPKVYGVSRRGIVKSYFGGHGEPLIKCSGVELDPKTGDILTTDFNGGFSTPVEPGGSELNRLHRTGALTTLPAFSGANAAVVRQDDTAFVVGHVLKTGFRVNAVMHVDLSRNVVMSVYEFPGLSAPPWGFTGVAVYGSRVVTCNGKGGPGATVKVNVKSHRAGAGGADYQLAVSVGRRPGVKMPNGEWLHLDVTDALFVATASNALNGITDHFAGRLDASGQARASIAFPASFPANLGVTLFVAGLIFDRSGVIQVTNTHWFEL